MENKVQSKLTVTKNTKVITTKEYEEKINIQVGKYFYATNTAFDHVEHEEFIKLCSLLRPGYKPPSAYQIGHDLLNNVHTDAIQVTKRKIKGETVSLSLHGWSNIHNCPLVCTSITTSCGDSILVDTVDTESYPHTVENLYQVVINALRSAREAFEVTIGSFVADDAANVQEMRNELSRQENLIHYGCSAHILNLLAKDLENPAVTSSVLKVIKYFRNKHIPAALYRNARGKKFVMPSEVPWNTMNESIRSYLDNRGILVQICQENKDRIDREIIKIVNDSQITMNCVDLIKILSPIAVALDRIQRHGTTIAVAVEIWNKLEIDLVNETSNVKKTFMARRKMALFGEHYTANMLDHRFLGRNLSSAQKKEAYEYITEVNRNFGPFIMALVAKAHPFPEYMFGTHFENTHPTLWWKSVILEDEKHWPDKDKFILFCEKLLTASAATTGLVQSKLRDRLGNEKAAQLDFLFKFFNHNVEKRKTDLSFIHSGFPSASTSLSEPPSTTHTPSELPSTSTTVVLNESDDEMSYHL